MTKETNEAMATKIVQKYVRFEDHTQYVAGEPGKLKKDIQEALAKKDAQLREVIEGMQPIAEIYIGMEGFEPKTAPEAYQQKVLKDMYNEAKEYQSDMKKKFNL